jgi:hypothetical protein
MDIPHARRKRGATSWRDRKRVSAKCLSNEGRVQLPKLSAIFLPTIFLPNERLYFGIKMAGRNRGQDSRWPALTHEHRFPSFDNDFADSELLVHPHSFAQVTAE